MFVGYNYYYLLLLIVYLLFNILLICIISLFVYFIINFVLFIISRSPSGPNHRRREIHHLPSPKALSGSAKGECRVGTGHYRSDIRWYILPLTDCLSYGLGSLGHYH